MRRHASASARVRKRPDSLAIRIACSAALSAKPASGSAATRAHGILVLREAFVQAVRVRFLDSSAPSLRGRVGPRQSCASVTGLPRRPLAGGGTSGGSRAPCVRIVRHLLRKARNPVSAKAFRSLASTAQNVSRSSPFIRRPAEAVGFDDQGRLPEKMGSAQGTGGPAAGKA